MYLELALTSILPKIICKIDMYKFMILLFYSNNILLLYLKKTENNIK